MPSRITPGRLGQFCDDTTELRSSRPAESPPRHAIFRKSRIAAEKIAERGRQQLPRYRDMVDLLGCHQPLPRHFFVLLLGKARAAAGRCLAFCRVGTAFLGAELRRGRRCRRPIGTFTIPGCGDQCRHGTPPMSRPVHGSHDFDRNTKPDGVIQFTRRRHFSAHFRTIQVLNELRAERNLPPKPWPRPHAHEPRRAPRWSWPA
jgi:hypothetical protein